MQIPGILNGMYDALTVDLEKENAEEGKTSLEKLMATKKHEQEALDKQEHDAPKKMTSSNATWHSESKILGRILHVEASVFTVAAWHRTSKTAGKSVRVGNSTFIIVAWYHASKTSDRLLCVDGRIFTVVVWHSAQ